MKNEMVRQGWNTVNPTQEQRQRMRAALEASLPQEKPKKSSRKDTMPEFDFDRWNTPMEESVIEAVPKRGNPGEKKSEPRHYQRKKASSPGFGAWAAAAAAMLVFLMAGSMFLKKMAADRDQNPVYASPQVTQNTEPAAEEQHTMTEAYEELLEIYQNALNQGWDGSQCAEADISTLVRDVATTDDLGYALIDLDGNGDSELLITDGNVIFDLYAMDGGNAVHVLTGWERNVYYLGEDRYIVNVGSGGAAVSYYRFSYLEGTKLIDADSVTFNADVDPVNPWFRNDKPVTEAEAQTVIDGYPYGDIGFTPLSGERIVSQYPEDAELLKQFAKAIPEALKDYTKSERQTFCFYDYDEDGVVELLLGADNSVYRVLKPEKKRISILVPTGEQAYAYVCADGVIESRAYAQGQYWHQYYRMPTEDIITIHCDSNMENWMKLPADALEGVPITAEEADEIMDSFEHLRLPWEPMSLFPAEIDEGNVEYGTAFFENIFMNMATGEFGNTSEALINAFQYYGFVWREGEGMIEFVEPEHDNIFFSALLGNLSEWEDIAEISYVVDGEDGIQRWAVVRFEAGGGRRYFTKTTLLSNGIEAASANDLRGFIYREDPTLALRAAVEGFAVALFVGDTNGMREYLPEGYSCGVYGSQGGLSSNSIIHTIKGLEDAQAQMEMQGYAEISVECLETPESDSYVYLTLNAVEENGTWKISYYGLEK